jgi:hypothetical protein
MKPLAATPIAANPALIDLPVTIIDARITASGPDVEAMAAFMVRVAAVTDDIPEVN